MNIKIENSHPTVELHTLRLGDTFMTPNNPETVYIVIEADFELNPEDGIYIVDLRTGFLYCKLEDEKVIPVSLMATASF